MSASAEAFAEIDVCKPRLGLTLWGNNRSWRFPNDPEGVEALTKQLRDKLPGLERHRSRWRLRAGHRPPVEPRRPARRCCQPLRGQGLGTRERPAGRTCPSGRCRGDRRARRPQPGPPAFCCTQTPWCAGFGAIFECGFSAFPTSFDPLADCSFGHAQRFRNVLLLPACLVQRPGSSASFFFPTRRLFPSHAADQTTV